VERSRDQDARHAAHARDLRRQISEYQQRIDSGGSAAGLADGLTTTDTQALYDRIRDLEDRIRSVHLTVTYLPFAYG